MWVLRRGYKKSAADISVAIRRLGSANVVMNRPAVEAGLSALDAGRDLVDGVIAYEGEWLGAEEFVSFNSKAICLRKHRAAVPAYSHSTSRSLKVWVQSICNPFSGFKCPSIASGAIRCPCLGLRVARSYRLELSLRFNFARAKVAFDASTSDNS
jgi:hypothetical protein